MSGFDNQTNRGRVQRILEIVELLQSSAKSNKAPPEEVAQMFKPVLDALGSTPAPAPSVPQPRIATPSWVSIREIAEKAPIDDFPVALAVFLNRISDDVHEIVAARKGKPQ